MSNPEKLQLIPVGQTTSTCRKCEQPITVEIVKTPDTRDACGNLMKGLEMPVSICACMNQKADEEQEKLRKWAKSMIAAPGGKLAPGMWRGATLDDYQWYADGVTPKGEPRGTLVHRDRLERYIATIDERVTKGQGLYLVGDRGMGKTMLLSILLTAAANKGIPGRFEHCAAMCKALTDRSRDADADGYLKQLLKVGILGIDDLGTENPVPWHLEALTLVLDGRYSAKLPTLITTNLSSDQLQERYDGLDCEAMGRLLDRLLQLNRPLVFRGDSFRQRLREEW